MVSIFMVTNLASPMLLSFKYSILAHYMNHFSKFFMCYESTPKDLRYTMRINRLALQFFNTEPLAINITKLITIFFVMMWNFRNIILTYFLEMKSFHWAIAQVHLIKWLWRIDVQENANISTAALNFVVGLSTGVYWVRFLFI